MIPASSISLCKAYLWQVTSCTALPQLPAYHPQVLLITFLPLSSQPGRKHGPFIGRGDGSAVAGTCVASGGDRICELSTNSYFSNIALGRNINWFTSFITSYFGCFNPLISISVIGSFTSSLLLVLTSPIIQNALDVSQVTCISSQ